MNLEKKYKLDAAAYHNHLLLPFPWRNHLSRDFLLLLRSCIAIGSCTLDLDCILYSMNSKCLAFLEGQFYLGPDD